jgi:hypothetical protein
MLLTAVDEITGYFFLIELQNTSGDTSEFLSIFSTVYRGTPYDVLRNPGWETLM